MPNVESFELDHTKVAAPYIRKASEYPIADGHTIVKYDLRFCQPNQSHLEMPAMHSMEHSMATAIRDHLDGVIDFGPMGCQTGFYMTVDTTAAGPELSEIHQAIKAAVADIQTWDAVPGASEVSCGWAASHDLAGAQRALQEFVDQADQWDEVWAS